MENCQEVNSNWSNFIQNNILISLQQIKSTILEMRLSILQTINFASNAFGPLHFLS